MKQKRIITKGHILDRTYINIEKQIVMIYATKKELNNIKKEPYRIMNLQEFKKEYKTMIQQ